MFAQKSDRNKFFNRDGSGNTRLNRQNCNKARYQKSRDCDRESEEVQVQIPTEGLYCHFDYLRGVMKGRGGREGLTEFLGYVANGDPFSIDENRQWKAGRDCPVYQWSILSDGGMRGGCHIIYKEDGDVDYPDDWECCLDLSGDFFSRRSNEDIWRLIKGFKIQNNPKFAGSWYGNFSTQRIDLALDDFAYNIIPKEQILQACVDGNQVGFNLYDPHSGKKMCGRKVDDLQTMTLYLGSRNSGKMARIYDHKKSGYKAQRFEVEFKRSYAKQIWQILEAIERIDDVDLDNNVQDIIGGLIVGAFDFRDKKNAVQSAKDRGGVDRFERLSFWQEFLDKIGNWIKVRPQRHLATIESTISWVHRQVAPFLAVLRKGLGAANFMVAMIEMLTKAEERFKQSHLMKERGIARHPKAYLALLSS